MEASLKEINDILCKKSRAEVIDIICKTFPDEKIWICGLHSPTYAQCLYEHLIKREAQYREWQLFQDLNKHSIKEYGIRLLRVEAVSSYLLKKTAEEIDCEILDKFPDMLNKLREWKME
jgi:hypothetical protein